MIGWRFLNGRSSRCRRRILALARMDRAPKRGDYSNDPPLPLGMPVYATIHESNQAIEGGSLQATSHEMPVFKYRVAATFRRILDAQ